MKKTIFAICAAWALTGLCESKVAVLPSQHHADEFDGPLAEIGVKKVQLSYDQFKNGSAFKSINDYSVVAVPPLFNYQSEINNLPSNTTAEVFGRLRDWLKAGGVLFLPDANYATPMVNTWLTAIDPELAMPQVDIVCNCAAPAALTDAGKAFGPDEISAGLSWAHLSLGHPEAWTVLAKCGHGEATLATRSYGKGLVVFTVLRQEYEAYFRNLLFWRFRTKNGREPTAADGAEFASRPRLPALPEVTVDVKMVDGRAVITLDSSNLTAMPPVDVIAGVQRLVGSLCVAAPDRTIVLNAIVGTDPATEKKAIVVNREIARFADGKRVLWCGAGFQREDPKCRSRILCEGYGSYSWWLDRLIRNRREIPASGGKIDLVFLGDSITHNWEAPGIKQLKELRKEFTILSAGYSGDTVPTLRWRVENGELDGFEAKAVMLMIGTNDAQFLKDLSPKDIANNIRELVKAIRRKQPKAKILLSSVFPRGEKPDDPLRLRVSEINLALEGIDAELKIEFTHFAEQFVSPDGTIAKTLMGDFLHPGTPGYVTWKNEAMAFFREATGKVPRTAVATPWRQYPDCWQMGRHDAKLAEIAASKGKIDLVFAGDSITHFWEQAGSNVLARVKKDYSVLDIGTAGDLVQELLWRLENGELDGYEAKFVMVMIGTNNAHLDCPSDIAAGIRKVLDTIAKKQPKAKILLLPVFPRGDHDDWLRPPVMKINSIIRDFPDGERVLWCDIYDRFLDEKGNVNWVMPDSLHPNERGYEIWLDAVRPYFPSPDSCR